MYGKGGRGLPEMDLSTRKAISPRCHFNRGSPKNYLQMRTTSFVFAYLSDSRCEIVKAEITFNHAQRVPPNKYPLLPGHDTLK